MDDKVGGERQDRGRKEHSECGLPEIGKCSIHTVGLQTTLVDYEVLFF